MISYILQVTLITSLVYLFYSFFLRNDTFYKGNRYFLLICIILSFSIPAIKNIESDNMFKEVSSISYQLVSHSKSNISDIIEKRIISSKTDFGIHQSKPLWDSVQWIYLTNIYWIGVIILGINLIVQIVLIIAKARSKVFYRNGNYKIIDIKDKAPFSFGRYIFIDQSKYDPQTYAQILLHEKIHAGQFHTLDLIIAEIAAIFQWFNPLAWKYKKRVGENLEFLTDSQVIHTYKVDKMTYQFNLLKISSPGYLLNITSRFNGSMVKKRIIMMNSSGRTLKSVFKYVAFTPLIFVLVVVVNGQKRMGMLRIDQNSQIMGKNISNTITTGFWSGSIGKKVVSINFKDKNPAAEWFASLDFDADAFRKLDDTRFSLKSEQGEIIFTGQLNKTGSGTFEFIPNSSFVDHAGNIVSDMRNKDAFKFFILKIDGNLLDSFVKYGYSQIGKSELTAFVTLNLDKEYLMFWKENGFNHLSIHQLITAKILNINEDFILKLKLKGPVPADFDQIISIKKGSI